MRYVDNAEKLSRPQKRAKRRPGAHAVFLLIGLVFLGAVLSVRTTLAGELKGIPILTPASELPGYGLPSTPTSTSSSYASPSSSSTSSSGSQSGDCADLAVGQSRTVNRDRIGNDVGTSQKYKVTQTSPNSIHVDLNIGFVGTSGAKAEMGDSSMSDAQVSQAFAAKANSCFQKHKSKLLDREGNTVDVSVISDSSKKQEIPMNDVTIESSGNARANSENWTAASTCQTIIHESFHLMGLVDGYEEKSFKTASGGKRWDCRAPERNNTIMSDPELALAGPTVPTITCVCVTSGCGKKAFSSQSSSGTPKCPTGYQESGGEGMGSTDMSADDVLAKEAAMKNGTRGTGMVLVKQVAAAKNPDPALARSQMQFIEKPRCRQPGETSSTYQQCAKNAYRTSTEEGCDSNVPPQCADIRWMD